MTTKSRACAEYDGIKWRYDEHGRGRTLYQIPCENCGKIIERVMYDSSKTYLCDYCKLVKKNKIKEKNKEQSEKDYEELGLSKKEKAFDKAVDRIAKQVKDIREYSEAIEVASRRTELYGSIPEMMVAIELLHLGYRIVPQLKIENYKVDFAIPKGKIIIEVDGGLYHSDLNPERDAIIRARLGKGWHVYHIPADYTAKHIQKLSVMIDKLQHQEK